LQKEKDSETVMVVKQTLSLLLRLLLLLLLPHLLNI
jgi:hypothetical protein